MSEFKVIQNEYNPLCGLTYEQVKEKIKKNPRFLVFLYNQTEEICKLAVQQDPYVLHHVRNQTEEICKIALRRDPNVLKYVRNQTEELCKLAVSYPHTRSYASDDFIHLFQ